MAEERDHDRTEPATPRRRQEARERGHVARSADLSSAAVLLAAILALQVTGRRLLEGITAAASAILGRLPELDGTRENLMLHVGGACTAALLAFVPVALIIVAAAVGINLVQVGFLFASEPLAPNLERLNPISGLGRIFSARSAARLLMGLFKVAAISIVVAWTLWAERNRLATLGGHAVGEIVIFALGVLLTLALRTALALVVLAILEYGYQRWQYDRDLRMSRQEVREELRRFEGDPKVRERRRSIQRRLATQRMVQEVRRATVVLVDSERFAVAIEYRKDQMEAPIVVAKGAAHLDRRIRELAVEHGVPIVERGELAQAIYRRVDVGQAIPGEFYSAIAEVLAYVVRLKEFAAA